MKTDTSREVESQFRNMVMERSPLERLRMGCSMFDAAKKIVESSIITEDPNITSDELRRQVFLRFYGIDYSESEREKILSCI